MADINIFALGGQDENGKDLFVIEVNEDIYIINSGIKFPISDRWGIDGIIADTTYLKNKQDKIKGLFLTHAHDESFAALPWLIMDIPKLKIYGSEFTIQVAQNRVAKYNIGHSNFQFKSIKEEKIGHVNIKTFPVANSIPGSLALNFQTPDGDIIFMSNMTIADLDDYGKTDLENIKNNSNNILALFQDSRRANYSGSSADKRSIKPFVEKAFKEAGNNRIIVGAYDEEMYTISEIIDLANQASRPVIFFGSASDNLFNIFKKTHKNVVLPRQVESYKNISASQNAVILVTGTWSRIYQRFLRIAANNDVFLKLKPQDNIIMITPPINGMEVEYSQMLDQVAKISPRITSVSDKDYYRLRPTRDDIFETVSILKPKFFFPISSLYRYQAVACKKAQEAGVRKDRAIILANGKMVYIKNQELASQKGRVKPVGDIIIQGFGVGDVSYEVIKERQNLSSGGLIAIASQVNWKTKQLVGEINVQVVGVVVKTELKKLIEEVTSVVIQKFEEAPKLNYREIQNSIRKRVQKIVSKMYNKEPLVVLTFYEV